MTKELHILKLEKNRLLITLSIISLFLLNASILKAQNNTPTEKVFVHINRNIFFNGSVLKYTAYVTNQTDLNLSTTIYFKLSNSENKVSLKWKNMAYNGVANGAIEIPDSLPKGSYSLQAFTNKMRNYPVDLIYSTPIFIQKLHEKPNDTLLIYKNAQITAPDSGLNTPSFFKISISPGNNPTINITPNTTIDSAYLSISIMENPAITNTAFINSFSQYINHTKKIKPVTSHLNVEKDFTILTGKLTTQASGRPLKNETVYLSTPDSTVHFKYATTDENGLFCFLIDSSYNNKPIFLQITGLNCENDSIIWEVYDKDLAKTEAPESFSHINNLGEKDYLEQLQKRELIDRVYNTKSIAKTNTTPTSAFTPNFFYSPDYTVRPDEYLSLLDFREISDNLLPMVKYKMVDGKMQFGMVVQDLTSVQYDNTLCFIDGVPCFNMKYIETLSSKDVDHIEVVNSVIMYGDLTFNGLIAIYTKHGKFNKAAFCNPYYTFVNYFNTDKAKLNVHKAGTPNILPDIYWNAGIILKNKALTIKSGKIEVGSSYIISINGLINGITPFAYQQIIKLN